MRETASGCVKASVYITKAEARAIRALAARRGRKTEHLIRDLMVDKLDETGVIDELYPKRKR